MSQENRKNGDYEKKLLSSCDDDMFMSGNIVLSYRPKSAIAGIYLDLDLQVGATAFLRQEEIEELIGNLQTFLDRVKNHKGE